MYIPVKPSPQPRWWAYPIPPKGSSCLFVISPSLSSCSDFSSSFFFKFGFHMLFLFLKVEAEVIGLRWSFLTQAFSAIDFPPSTALVGTPNLDKSCFHFYLIQNTFKFTFYILWPMGYIEVCYFLSRY